MLPSLQVLPRVWETAPGHQGTHQPPEHLGHPPRRSQSSACSTAGLVSLQRGVGARRVRARLPLCAGENASRLNSVQLLPPLAPTGGSNINPKRPGCGIPSRAFSVPMLFPLFLQQLLECNKCRNSYHPECLGPNYPTKPTKKKKVWVRDFYFFFG